MELLYLHTYIYILPLVHTLTQWWKWSTMHGAGLTIRSNVGFSVSPKDTSTRGSEELGVNPPTVHLAYNLLYLLSHTSALSGCNAHYTPGNKTVRWMKNGQFSIPTSSSVVGETQFKLCLEGGARGKTMWLPKSKGFIPNVAHRTKRWFHVSERHKHSEMTANRIRSIQFSSIQNGKIRRAVSLNYFTSFMCAGSQQEVSWLRRRKTLTSTQPARLEEDSGAHAQLVQTHRSLQTPFQCMQTLSNFHRNDILEPLTQFFLIHQWFVFSSVSILGHLRSSGSALHCQTWISFHQTKLDMFLHHHEHTHCSLFRLSPTHTILLPQK